MTEKGDPNGKTIDNGDVQTMKRRLAESEMINANMKEEFDKIKQVNGNIRELLESERNERKKIEEEAIKQLNQVKQYYESEVKKLESKNKEKVEKLKKDSESLKEQVDKLMKSLENERQEKRKIEDKIYELKKDYEGRLKSTTNKNEKSTEERIESLKRQVNEYHEQAKRNLQMFENERDERKKTEESLKSKIDRVKKDCDKRVSHLTADKGELEQKISSMKRELVEYKNKAEDYLDMLEKERAKKRKIEETTVVDATQNKREYDPKIENDKPNNLEFDLRMANREIERLKNTISTIREMNIELRRENKELKDAGGNLDKIKQDKSHEIDRLTKRITELEEKHSIEVNEFKMQKVKLEERVKAMEEHCKDLKEIQTGSVNWQEKYEQSNKRIEILNNQLKEMESSKNVLNMQIDAIKSELAEKEKVIKKLVKNNEVLKNACSQIEEQAEAFRIKYEGTNEQKLQLLDSNNQTISEQEKLIAQIEYLRNKLDKELQEKEQMANRFEEERIHFEQSLQSEKDKIKDLELQLEKEKEKFVDYEERLSEKDHCLYSSDELISKLQEKVHELELQLHAIKEEAATHISTISALKIENHRLIKTLDSEKHTGREKFHQYENLLEELKSEIETKDTEHSTERVALQETINQQLKLIDFLKDKVDQLDRQKKPWFSGKTPTKTSSEAVKTLEWKDLDRALCEERTKNRRISEQLYKTKCQLTNYKAEVEKLRKQIKTNANEPKIVNTPIYEPDNKPTPRHHNIKDSQPTSSKDDDNKASMKGMYHDIPHRFVDIICKRSAKCFVCKQVMSVGSNVRKCSECKIISHMKCASDLPNNCGLPQELLQHAFGMPYKDDNYIARLKLHPMIDDKLAVPSAPPAISPLNSSSSSATTDNNDSYYDGDHVANDIREIEEICLNKEEEEKFSFTDSMLETLGNDENVFKS